MLQALLRRRKDDAGFTLVELMIVILIIGILIAIGLPTFLGARERAQDRAAQALLRNGLTAGKVFYTDFSFYSSGATVFTPTAAKSIEPSIDWTASTVGKVGIATPASDQLVLTTTSGSGYVFCIKDVTTGASAGIFYARSVAGGGACPGAGQAWETDATAGWAHS